MENIETLRPDESPVLGKLATEISAAVMRVMESHPQSITYLEVVGALELIKADYILEQQAINLSDIN